MHGQLLTWPESAEDPAEMSKVVMAEHRERGVNVKEHGNEGFRLRYSIS